MPIYRGNGGSGDASTDAYASQVALDALTATNKANEASNSATAAAASATAAASSKTNAASSATAAASSATAAASSASAASTSETNAGTSETNAASSATSAASSATTATTQASAASTSATNAATSASNASSSATAAASSASAASTSATNAATSATSAGTAQTAAETAQTAAETAQAAAEAAQTAIDGFFLGALSSTPTVDGNGNAVTAGDWYFDTTSNQTYIYDGSSWQSINPDLVGDTTPQLGGTLDANGNNIDMGVNVITDAKVGQWDTAYGWGNHASAGYLTTVALNDVSDVTITTPTNGQVLKYNGTAWVNAADSDSGTVTSVTQTVPTGFTVSGSPVTTSGTLAIAFDTGYSLPLTASQTNWNTAYGWGDHSIAGYLTGNQTITLSGAITGSGTTSITTTLSTIDGGTY